MNEERQAATTAEDEFSNDRAVWTEVAPFLAWALASHGLEALDLGAWTSFLLGGIPAAGVFAYFKVWQYRVTPTHMMPFVLWMFLMSSLPDPQGVAYALRTVICLSVFLLYRPWRWYESARWKNVPLAVAVGLGVFVAWVLPETAWMGRNLPWLQDLYLKWGVMGFGSLPEWIEEPVTAATSPYAPGVCGWPLSIMRLVGSAFVIAIIEEFFWRGFLYRWLMQRKFTDVDLGRMQTGLFLLVAVFFGFEHVRWLAGIVAGLAYGWLIIRTRDIWAGCIAHVITNFVLAWYVLQTGHYAFW